MPGLSRHQPVAPRRNARSQASRRNGSGVNGTSVRNSATPADPPMLVCARYDVLRALAEASGVEQITLWAIPNKNYQMSVRIRHHAQERYLATLWNKATPRVLRIWVRPPISPMASHMRRS